MFQYYGNIELCYVNGIQFISYRKFHLLYVIVCNKYWLKQQKFALEFYEIKGRVIVS